MQTILSILTPLIAFVLGVWFFIAARRHTKQADDNAQAATAIEAIAWDRFKTLFKEALPWLCTQAEISLGGGTGELKQAYVITEALKLLPDNLSSRINEDLLIGYIKNALSAAKDLWEKTPRVLGVPLISTSGFVRIEGDDIEATYTLTTSAKDGQAEVIGTTVKDSGDSSAAEPAELLQEDAVPAEELAPSNTNTAEEADSE